VPELLSLNYRPIKIIHEDQTKRNAARIFLNAAQRISHPYILFNILFTACRIRVGEGSRQGSGCHASFIFLSFFRNNEAKAESTQI
jgi:hypothetical protein